MVSKWVKQSFDAALVTNIITTNTTIEQQHTHTHTHTHKIQIPATAYLFIDYCITNTCTHLYKHIYIY